MVSLFDFLNNPSLGSPIWAHRHPPFGGCLCALWAQGLVMYIILDMCLYWIYFANNCGVLFSWGVSVCPKGKGLGHISTTSILLLTNSSSTTCLRLRCWLFSYFATNSNSQTQTIKVFPKNQFSHQLEIFQRFAFKSDTIAIRCVSVEHY